MCISIKYNIINPEQSNATFHRTIDSEGIAFALRSEEAAEAFLRGMSFELMHVTTSSTNCSGQLKKGLLPMSSVLRDRNSELGFKLASLGYYLSEDCAFVDREGNTYVYTDSQEAIRALSREDCVNAYLYCSGNIDGYDQSPEILRKLSSARRYDQNLACAVSEWEETAKPYCIYFCVPFSDIDVISGLYAEKEEYQATSLLTSLITAAKDLGEGAVHDNIAVSLKPGVTIPSSSLTIEPLSSPGIG